MTWDSRVVFHVHLVKTAGSTVNNSLRDYYPPVSRYVQAKTKVDAVRLKNYPQALFGLPPERTEELRYISGHMPLGAALRFREESSRPVSITLLLRDGFERAVSNLQQLARQCEYQFSYREILDDPVLGEFFLSNHQTRAISVGETGWDEWQRCYACLLDLTLYLNVPEERFAVSPVVKADLEQAVCGLSKVDVLGLQSQFDEWWRRCHDIVGWPLAHSAPMNVGRKKDKHAAPKIPADIMDELRERNRLDASLYEAARELLSLQG